MSSAAKILLQQLEQKAATAESLIISLKHEVNSPYQQLLVLQPQFEPLQLFSHSWHSWKKLLVYQHPTNLPC